MWVGLAFLLTACGGGGGAAPTSPTATAAPAPVPAPAPAPTPSPLPTTGTLTGVVIAAVSGARINGAVITVLDGMSGGRTATTTNGDYRFENLQIGNTNFSTRAKGYLEFRAGTFVDGTNKLDFTLPTVVGTYAGRVRAEASNSFLMQRSVYDIDLTATFTTPEQGTMRYSLTSTTFFNGVPGMPPSVVTADNCGPVPFTLDAYEGGGWTFAGNSGRVCFARLITVRGIVNGNTMTGTLRMQNEPSFSTLPGNLSDTGDAPLVLQRR